MRILIIRRDNIGDLVCTLPLIRRLREQFPQAWIGALVTRYNTEVLYGNADLNAVFTYQKSKHLAEGESAFGAMLERIGQLWQLRRMKLDLVLLPASGTQSSARRMARLVGAKRIVSLCDVPENSQARHEVERTAGILRTLNLPDTELPVATLSARADLQQRMLKTFPAEPKLLLGLHISSRKPSQRWPAEHFIGLMRQLHSRQPDLRFALFWSPGDENNPLHPGDDGKARQILAACQGLPLTPCPTQSLGELIAGLSMVDALVCSDGGHMHLGAGLGKPIVCLFGESDTERWYPWGVPHELLQAPSRQVKDIGVAEVIAALGRLSVTMLPTSIQDVESETDSIAIT